MDAKGIFILLVTLYCASFGWARILKDHSNGLDVLHFGAVGDGKTDDSKAFLEAWKQVCEKEASNSRLIIPAGKTFLLSPITFQGPCKSTNINLQVLGDIRAPDYSKWDKNINDRWITFHFINGLTINGGGNIDGQGQSWWNCRSAKKCWQAPTGMLINNCNNLQLSGVHFINSPMMHIVINDCIGVEIANISIVAPDDSPNTDGIHIGSSKNITIQDCIIGTGDDCISIGSNSSGININKVFCGPGHGISVGSLGKSQSYDVVENVYVKNCTFTRTMNGARIKTWQGGSGYARDIMFQQIIMDSVDNPIIIDQYYCNGYDGACGNHSSAVQVSHASFIGVVGTSTNEVPINLSCSETVGCTNLLLSNVDLKSTVQGKEVVSKYINAHGTAKGHVIPEVPALVRS